MEMNAYQTHALLTDQVPAGEDAHELVPLLGLAGEVGELLSEYKKHLRDGDAHQLYDSRVLEELGDILWYIAAVGARFGLSLEEIAKYNLDKCSSHWGKDFSTRSVHGRFDSRFPTSEQFPAIITVHLKEIRNGDEVRVRATCNGEQMGEELTNNAYADDGYRFHDVFHLACVAGLGWSPVTRRNLRLKRKSDPRIDEIEDGGRASVIEEGITAMVFSYAVEHNRLRGVTRVDHDLLNLIEKMTAHLEVKDCALAEWEQTILMAYPVWSQVQERGGGTVIVDMHKRSLTFSAGEDAEPAQ